MREQNSYTKVRKSNDVSTRSLLPYVSCGQVFHPVLPIQISKDEQPVLLTEVTVQLEKTKSACVLLNFSAFLTSILKGERFNDLTFRLVKTCSGSRPKVLREWPFRRAFVNNTNIKEPIVYDFCECFQPTKEINCTYRFELVEANLSDQSSYDITNKIMTAQVFEGNEQKAGGEVNK